MAQGCDGRGLSINEINLEEDEQVESSAGGIIEQSTRKSKVWFEWMQRYPKTSDLYRVHVDGLPPGPPEEDKLKIEKKQANRFKMLYKKMDEQIKGVKYDCKKLQYSLLPWEQLEDVVRVLMYGAEKYDADNWKKVPDAHTRYINAAARHLAEIMKGNRIDPESGLPHVAHLATNALFIAFFETE